MSRRRASARRVKKNLSYTVEEAADVLGVHRHTVRRWITSGVLPALTERRPHLILGHDLRAFLCAAAPGRATLKPGELYCVKCRLPKQPALGMAEYMTINERIGNLRGFCSDCEILMHRRVALDKLDAVASDLDITRQHAQFFPVGELPLAIVREWIGFLKTEKNFGEDDPLFPASEVELHGMAQSATVGLSRRHWQTTTPIRRIFRAAFTRGFRTSIRIASGQPLLGWVRRFVAQGRNGSRGAKTSVTPIC
jgi:excisionase family DNA binding protein